MNLQKKWKKQPIKLKLCFVTVSILIVIGSAFGIYAFRQKTQGKDVFATTKQPIEHLTIKAIPLNGNEETITVFTTDPLSYQPLDLTEGARYTLVVDGTFEKSAEIMISYDTAKIKISENPDIRIDKNTLKMTLDGKKQIQTEILGVESACFFDGVTMDTRCMLPALNFYRTKPRPQQRRILTSFS